MIVVDTLAQLKIYKGILDQLPEVKALVAWGLDKIPEDIGMDSRVYTFKNFLDMGKKIQDSVIDEI